MSAPDQPPVGGEAAGGGLPAVLTVARLAFREASRSRLLHALVGATVFAALVSLVLAYGVGDDPERHRKVVCDLSLSAIALLGTIAAIFLGTSLVAQEVERRTIYLVLARPVSRAGFVVGKFLGLAGVLAVAVAAMSAGFLVVFALAGGSPSPAVLAALAGTYLELVIVGALAILLSVAAHPVEGAVIAFVAALTGHVTADLNRLGETLVREATDATRPLAELASKGLYVAYVLLPNLENTNLRAHAAHDLPVSAGHLLGGAAYTAVYATIVVVLATVAFRRRGL